MNKRLAVALTAAALLLPQLPGLAVAAPDEHHDGLKITDEDRSAFTDARIAALKAGLKLTPAQEKNWPAVEAAIRDAAKARAARWAEFREKFKDEEGHKNLIERLQHRAKALEARGADLLKLADASKPLYDSLDDSQKRRLGFLLHHLHGGEGPHPGFGGPGHHWGFGGEHWGGHE